MTAPQFALVPPVDTLTFSLTEERVVVNDTVRIVVRVHAQEGTEASDEALRSAMRHALRSFVDAPDWQLSPARRETQPTGVETVTMTASVRVAEAENHGLKERAERVSRPGLTLSGPFADLAMPNDVLQAAESDIRRALLARAMEEAGSLGEAGGPWVVHAVAFGGIAAAREVVPPGAATRGMVARAPGGPGGPAEDDMAANAARMSMTAAVTLRRLADPPSR